MQNDIVQMTQQRYGYGLWAAPYWFIGLEEGMANQDRDTLDKTMKCWRDLGSRELDDCRQFHRCLGEERWHGAKPRLQPTWRPLMLLLMTFTQQECTKADLREYQRERWGASDGVTCVIELSGAAASNLMVERDRGDDLLDPRISHIRERLREHQPRFVVMYGASQKWQELTGRYVAADDIAKVGSTLMVRTKHPTSRGSTNQHWQDLGDKLRAQVT